MKASDRTARVQVDNRTVRVCSLTAGQLSRTQAGEPTTESLKTGNQEANVDQTGTAAARAWEEAAPAVLASKI